MSDEEMTKLCLVAAAPIAALITLVIYSPCWYQ
jgi:hypothetical protein